MRQQRCLPKRIPSIILHFAFISFGHTPGFS
jgi:hypothetical protein